MSDGAESPFYKPDIPLGLTPFTPGRLKVPTKPHSRDKDHEPAPWNLGTTSTSPLQERHLRGMTTFFTDIISIGMLLRVVLVGGYGVPYLYSRTTQLIAGFINLELPCARF